MNCLECNCELELVSESLRVCTNCRDREWNSDPDKPQWLKKTSYALCKGEDLIRFVHRLEQEGMSLKYYPLGCGDGKPFTALCYYTEFTEVMDGLVMSEKFNNLKAFI